MYFVLEWSKMILGHAWITFVPFFSSISGHSFDLLFTWIVEDDFEIDAGKKTDIWIVHHKIQPVVFCVHKSRSVLVSCKSMCESRLYVSYDYMRVDNYKRPLLGLYPAESRAGSILCIDESHGLYMRVAKYIYMGHEFQATHVCVCKSPPMCSSHELCNWVANLFELQHICESRTFNNPRLRMQVTTYVCKSELSVLVTNLSMSQKIYVSRELWTTHVFVFKSPPMCVSHELCMLVTNLCESQNTCESRTLNNPRLCKYVTNHVCGSRTMHVSHELFSWVTIVREWQYICKSRTISDPRLHMWVSNYVCESWNVYVSCKICMRHEYIWFTECM